eukprot:scaffold247_cov172-Ochromonas_danica.AAC.32
MEFCSVRQCEWARALLLSRSLPVDKLIIIDQVDFLPGAFPPACLSPSLSLAPRLLSQSLRIQRERTHFFR